MEYKFIEDKEIIEFAEKYLHLSYSTEKEVGEFFKELKNYQSTVKLGLLNSFSCSSISY